jgi:hypothetical protein
MARRARSIFIPSAPKKRVRPSGQVEIVASFALKRSGLPATQRDRRGKSFQGLNHQIFSSGVRDRPSARASHRQYRVHSVYEAAARFNCARLAVTRSCCLIKRDGTPRQNSKSRPTLRFCRCRPSARSSIRSRTSGSSRATTSCPIASSNPTTISSIIAANPGTNSQTNLGASCPSERENGLTGFDQRELV